MINGVINREIGKAGVESTVSERQRRVHRPHSQFEIGDAPVSELRLIYESDLTIEPGHKPIGANAVEIQMQVIAVTAAEIKNCLACTASEELCNPLVNIVAGEFLMRPNADCQPVLLLLVAQVSHHALRTGLESLGKKKASA